MNHSFTLIPIETVLSELENAMSITPANKFEGQLTVTRDFLSDAFGINIGARTIPELLEDSQSNMGAIRGIDSWLVTVCECMKSLAYNLMYSSFKNSVCEVLKDVQYMGLDRTNLLNTLNHLSSETAVSKVPQPNINAITSAADALPVGIVRRLVQIMLLFHSLQINEYAGFIASYLVSTDRATFERGEL